MNLVKSLVSVLAVTAVIAASPITAFAAATASLTMSASTTSIATGQTFTVSVIEDGGTNVTAVTTKYTYDATKIELISDANSSCAGTAFPSAVPSSAGSITCYGTTPVNGQAVAANLTFRANAAGSVSIATAAGSQVASNGENQWNGAVSAANVQIVAPTTNPGRGAETPTPTPVTTPRTTTVAPTSTTGQSSTAPEVTAPATTSDKGKTSTTAKDSAKNLSVAKTGTNAKTIDGYTPVWLYVLAILAVLVASGYLAGKRVVAARAGNAPSETIIAPAVVAAAKSAKTNAKPAVKKAVSKVTTKTAPVVKTSKSVKK